MGKLKTPDWILKGGKTPSKKEKGRIFKIRKCPKCGSDKVSIVLGMEEGKSKGEWECKECSWEGIEISEKEMNEEELMKHLDDGEEVS